MLIYDEVSMGSSITRDPKVGRAIPNTTHKFQQGGNRKMKFSIARGTMPKLQKMQTVKNKIHQNLRLFFKKSCNIVKRETWDAIRAMFINNKNMQSFGKRWDCSLWAPIRDMRTEKIWIKGSRV